MERNVKMALALLIISVLSAVIVYAALPYLNYFFGAFIQNRVGKLHPQISIIGIVIGVPLFGLMGIVIGPLLLS